MQGYLFLCSPQNLVLATGESTSFASSVNTHSLSLFLSLSLHSTLSFYLSSLCSLFNAHCTSLPLEQCGNLYTACCKLCVHTQILSLRCLYTAPTIVTWSRDAEADLLLIQTSGWITYHGHSYREMSCTMCEYNPRVPFPFTKILPGALNETGL